ncbi:nucleotidyltransferase domain-containing protein [Methylobacterium sp. WL6]|uniref:nucleotidyltransferase family protein n=1 Tax=Methylobacterium sp. WL6 TaxID=2603901 RepID=UPI001FF064AB|nr:nucleotidyltransferase domain-containing protein [Methylobacterium sp. WL6]
MSLTNSQRAWIIDWAERTDAVAEVWLFGSRAKGTARPDSDIDLVVDLYPPNGNDDWAFGKFNSLADAWQGALGTLLEWPVSLVAFGPDMEEVRATAVLLWKREP